MARAAHQAAGIQNQRHRAIAEDGGPGHVGHLTVVAFEVLHHDLVLPEQFVHQQCDAASIRFDTTMMVLDLS